MNNPTTTGLPAVTEANQIELAYQRSETFPIAIGGEAGTSSGIDAAVLIIRRMLATGVQPPLDDVARNPLIYYAWRDFKGAGVEATRAEQQRLLEKFSQSFSGRSFEQIMLSCTMLETLWVCPHARLFATDRLRRRVGADENYSRERDQVALFDIKRAVARESLVHWDGTQPLTQVVQGKFGFRDSDDGEFINLNNPGHMIWVRVLYTPRPGIANAPGWRDVRQWQINPKGYMPARGEEGELLGSLTEGEWGSRIYSLSAVVRLRRGEEEEDYCRVYDDTGDYVIPDKPPIIVQPPYVNNDWKIGEPGYTYALFYKKVEKRLRSTSHEVCVIKQAVHDRWAFVEREMAKITKMESGDGTGLPPNTPTGPSSQAAGPSTASSNKKKRGIPTDGATPLPKRSPRGG